MKVHLVDGTYELFRCWFAVPSSTAPDGREVGAVRGLVRTLRALLRADDVTHVGVAFDHTVESFRNDLFDGYKTGDGLDPDLFGQFPLAEDAARALGLTVWPMVDFEADDAIATAVHRYADAPGVEQVVVCSPDKDFAQLVDGTHVVLWSRKDDTFLDEDGVRAKFGVAPASIPDFLALVGDTADGIPGVPRWGAKSTATVLAHYGTIDAIPDDAAEWAVKVRGAASLAASLVEHREAARLYRTLATLRDDAPVDESLDDLEWRGVDEDALAAFRATVGG